jgi:hypothetical protein
MGVIKVLGRNSSQKTSGIGAFLISTGNLEFWHRAEFGNRFLTWATGLDVDSLHGAGLIDIHASASTIAAHFGFLAMWLMHHAKYVHAQAH